MIQRTLMRTRLLTTTLAILVILSAAFPAAYSLRTDDALPSLQFSSVLSSPVQMSLALQTHLLGQLSEPLGASTNVDVTFDPNLLPQNEPSVALNPLNGQNLVAGANDYRLIASGGQAWAGAYTTFDGGRTWSNQLIHGFPGDPTTTVLSGFASAGDPAVAFSRNGTAYYSILAFKIQGTSAVAGSVFLSRSNDGGSSFPQTAIVALGSSRVFNDKSYLTVDKTTGSFGGRVYVSWTRFTSTSGSIMESFSSDGGRSFSTPVTISTSTVNQGSVPVVGPSGDVYVVWNDLSNRRIVEAKSTNGGVSFNPPVQIAPNIPLASPLPNSHFRVNSIPAAAADDTNGNVYAAWADYGSGNADILFSKSTDGGASWNPPIRLNDDTTSNDQFFPWLAVSSGRLSADFYDRRLDPANHLMDVFYTQSTDGGASFTPNARITDVSSNPDAVLFSGGQSFIGDYIGIATNATTAHPVWTDLRNVSSSTPADQDIFTDSLPSHDMALAAISPAKSVVYQGVSSKPLNITGLVRNLGVVTETSLTVSFFANGTLIGSTGISSMAGRSNLALTFQWNTNTLVKGGYALAAQVSIVTGETNVANNQLTDGVLRVNFPGDVNGDKVVNIIDLSIVGAAYATSPGGLNWNPNADINNDGIINIIDVSILGANYGKVDP